MLLAAIVILACVAVVSPWISRAFGRFAGVVLAAFPAVIFFQFAKHLGAVSGGEPLTQNWSWIPSLGVDLSFRLDGLSLLFAMLITGIGSLIVLYAVPYLKDHPLRHRFVAYLIGFMTAMLGLVLSDNILLLFAFWELTSITSYLLIGFEHQKTESRRSATQALVITALGGLAMFAGLFMLGLAAGDITGIEGGVWNLSEILAVGGLTEHALWPGILVCVLLGAITKSAQFPFHFWLPNAMAAPTPVSAYLHSSTMVKAGVYLVMRLNPAFEGNPAWAWSLVGFGGVTMLVGAFLATRETQFKKVLAYSTVSSLGIMIMFTGVGGEYGAIAAVSYLLAHAFFKACLFLVAGTVTHETGVKDVEKLGWIKKTMPVTAICGLVGALSMAGAPPLFGFVAKENLVHAAMEPKGVLGSGAAPLLFIAVVVAAVLTVFAALMVGWRPFYAAPTRQETGKFPEPKGHEPGPFMLLGPAVLVVLTVLAPFAPGLYAEPMIQGGIDSVMAAEPYVSEAEAPVYQIIPVGGGDSYGADSYGGEKSGDYEEGAHKSHLHLSIWYFLTHPWPGLFITMAVLAAGVFVYFWREVWRARLNTVLSPLTAIGPQANYFRSLDATEWFASRSTMLIQNGYLRHYITMILTVLVSLVVWTLVRGERVEGMTEALKYRDFGILDVTLLGVVVAAAIACTRFRSRLATVATLGAVGYGVATVFVLLGVPDIAMTQFSIETLTAIIFVLVVWSLPRFNVYSSGKMRFLDASVGIGFGAVMTVMVLIASGVQVGGGEGPFAPISGFMGEKSYVEAFGKNVVNVILVDFRGVDTMGEIMVLGIAAVGVYTLLRARPGRDLGGFGEGLKAPRLVGGGSPPEGPGSPAIADPDERGEASA